MRILPLAAAALALAFAGCAADDGGAGTASPATTTSTSSMADHSARTHNVTIAGNAFGNGTLAVYAGDTVEWAHADGNIAHTVTADDGSFDSSPNCGVGGVGVPLSQVCMVEGDTFSFKFAKAGTVPYHCKVHASMTGTITVQEHPA